MAGGRWDRIANRLTDNLRTGGVDLSGDADFSKATGRIGVTWNPTPDLGLWASWGQGFLPPATEELANNPAALGGFNLALVPATSRGEEVGVRGSLGTALSWDAAIFYLETEDDFGRYRVPGRPLETFYGNLGSTRRYGVEARLGWQALPNLDAQLAYTYNHFKYTEVRSLFGDFQDVWMPNSPEHHAFLDLSWKPSPRLSFGVSSELQTRSYVDQTNATWAGGYTLFHVRASWAFRIAGVPAELRLYVKNLTGKEYIAFTEPDPDGNSYQPAPKRQVFAGLRVSFGS